MLKLGIDSQPDLEPSGLADVQERMFLKLGSVDASRLGKGIGAWLLEDIIGLWTGDWTAAIVNRAEGGKDREPL